MSPGWLIQCRSQDFEPRTDPAAQPLMPATRTRMTTNLAASAPSHALTSGRPNMRPCSRWPATARRARPATAVRPTWQQPRRPRPWRTCMRHRRTPSRHPPRMRLPAACKVWLSNFRFRRLRPSASNKLKRPSKGRQIRMKRTTMKTNYVHHITQPLAVFIYTMKDCNLRLPSPLKSNQNNKHYNSYYCLEMKSLLPSKGCHLKTWMQSKKIHEITNFQIIYRPAFLSFY